MKILKPLDLASIPIIPHGGLRAGLKIAEKIIEAHRGKIWISNTATGVELSASPCPLLEEKDKHDNERYRRQKNMGAMEMGILSKKNVKISKKATDHREIKLRRPFSPR